MFCKCEIAILDASKNVKLTVQMVTNILSCSNFSNYYEFAFTGLKLVHYFHTMKGLTCHLAKQKIFWKPLEWSIRQYSTNRGTRKEWILPIKVKSAKNLPIMQLTCNAMHFCLYRNTSSLFFQWPWQVHPDWQKRIKRHPGNLLPLTFGTFKGFILSLWRFLSINSSPTQCIVSRTKKMLEQTAWNGRCWRPHL